MKNFATSTALAWLAKNPVAEKRVSSPPSTKTRTAKETVATMLSIIAWRSLRAVEAKLQAPWDVKKNPETAKKKGTANLEKAVTGLAKGHGNFTWMNTTAIHARPFRKSMLSQRFFKWQSVSCAHCDSIKQFLNFLPVLSICSDHLCPYFIHIEG